MKMRYVILLILLLGGAVLFVLEVLAATCLHPHLDKVLQGTGVFIALIASVIALAIADPKRKHIKIECAVDIEKTAAPYKKSDLSQGLQVQFKDYSDPLESRQVTFKLTNCTGITLKKPTLTFILPKDRMHPVSGTPPIQDVIFNSNLFNSPKEMAMLEMAGSIIISNSVIPYWNPDVEIAIWIRMIVTDPRVIPFDVEVSINSENAEGVTVSKTINPLPAYHSN